MVNIAKRPAVKRKSCSVRHSKRFNKPSSISSIIERIIESKEVAMADKALNEKYEPNAFKDRLSFLKENFVFCLAARHVPSDLKKSDIEKNDYWLVLNHIISEIQDIGAMHVVKGSVFKNLNK